MAFPAGCFQDAQYSMRAAELTSEAAAESDASRIGASRASAFLATSEAPRCQLSNRKGGRDVRAFTARIRGRRLRARVHVCMCVSKTHLVLVVPLLHALLYTCERTSELFHVHLFFLGGRTAIRIAVENSARMFELRGVYKKRM